MWNTDWPDYSWLLGLDAWTCATEPSSRSLSGSVKQSVSLHVEGQDMEALQSTSLGGLGAWRACRRGLSWCTVPSACVQSSVLGYWHLRAGQWTHSQPPSANIIPRLFHCMALTAFPWCSTPWAFLASQRRNASLSHTPIFLRSNGSGKSPLVL